MSILYLTEQGSYLRKQGGRYVVTKNEEELLSLPQAAVERVVILGNCMLSTPAINELLTTGIDVIFLGRNGSFKGLLEPGYPKNVFIRLAQYERTLETDFALEMARMIVHTKLSNAIQIQERWQRRGWLTPEATALSNQIIKIRDQLPNAEDNATLRAYEASASRTHFALFAQTLPPPYEWNGRNRRPPRDPVNALLSLTYMLTLGHIVSSCYAHGLDPAIGYLHELDYSRPSLALDLLEPLRPLYCDHFVIRLLQHETLALEDFQFGNELGCRLQNSAFRTYLEKFQDLLNKKGHGNLPSLANSIDRITTETATALKERRIPLL